VSGKVPPGSRARTGRTVFEKFTGRAPVVVEEITVPPLPREVYVIGPCDAIAYTTLRDGKTQSFIHEFAPKDRPLLAINEAGTQMLLVGGAYDFTPRGIVDRSDAKTRREIKRGIY
jgi:hypothetical protein